MKISPVISKQLYHSSPVAPIATCLSQVDGDKFRNIFEQKISNLFRTVLLWAWMFWLSVNYPIWGWFKGETWILLLNVVLLSASLLLLSTKKVHRMLDRKLNCQLASSQMIPIIPFCLQDTVQAFHLNAWPYNPWEGVWQWDASDRLQWSHATSQHQPTKSSVSVLIERSLAAELIYCFCESVKWHAKAIFELNKQLVWSFLRSLYNQDPTSVTAAT